MLVLSRNVGERIRIGHDIELVVVRIRNGGVRLGIAAPRDLNIVRDELVDRQHANTPTPADVVS